MSILEECIWGLKSLRFLSGTFPNVPGGAAPAPSVDNLLLETADNFLLETGDLLVFE